MPLSSPAHVQEECGFACQTFVFVGELPMSLSLGGLRMLGDSGCSLLYSSWAVPVAQHVNVALHFRT